MLLAYDRIEWPKRAKLPGQATPCANFKNKVAYSGELSPSAKKKLKRAITLITATALPKKAMNYTTNKQFTFRLNFITLTLPALQGSVTDKQLIRDCLRLWLMKMKDHFNLKSYVWRAERQKNGNLHFHLVTDTYIPYDKIRDHWNKSLSKLGFIDAFEKKHGHRHPNSTDVHAIKNVKNLAGYFMKYMAKDASSADVIDGKVWDCSTNLKQKHNCEMLLSEEEVELLARVERTEEIKRKDNEHCTMWFLSYEQFERVASYAHRKKYLDWLESIRNPPDKKMIVTEVKTSENQQANSLRNQEEFTTTTQKRSQLKNDTTTQIICPF